MSDSGKAVFLSYASQDADAARRIFESLRAAGVEVWFDQSELVGGDAWDAKIRKQIKECALFVPIISANTQKRREGYFRLEWRLADQRTHLMGKANVFIVPVCIDETPNQEADVPDSFLEVQWSRLPNGNVSEDFAEHVQHLLACGDPAVTPAPFSRTPPPAETSWPVKRSLRPTPVRRKRGPVIAAIAGGVILAVAFWQRWKLPVPPIPAPPPALADRATAVAPKIDPKSIAVLAFRQQSADPENEYLCEAISDELCHVLGRVPGLKVAASASAFVFKKDKRVRPSEMAAQLGVAYLVDGRVQKIGSRVRVSAELIKASDESVVWKSDPLDYETKDMFGVQDAVVGAIATSLQLRLGTTTNAVTVNPEAFRLYYEGRRAWTMRAEAEYIERAEDLFRRAIAADAKLGRAYSGLADVRRVAWGAERDGLAFADRNSARFREIMALAETALRLEPDSAEGHAARGALLWQGWQLAEAERELRTAIRLNPNYADAHLVLGRLLSTDGRLGEGLAEMKLASELDPLSSRIFDNYAGMLREAGRYSEALVLVERAVALQPDSEQAARTKMQVLSALERHDEAIALARKVGGRGVHVLARAGKLEEAAEVHRTMPPRRGAAITPLVALGRSEEALNSLNPDDAVINAISGLYYYYVVDPIRADPRFVSFLRTLGIKEAHDRAQAWRAAHPPEKPAAKP